MDIGKPRRIHTVEPLWDPVPRTLPSERPAEAPRKVEPEPRKVPSRT